jgi:hypothetical protein
MPSLRTAAVAVVVAIGAVATAVVLVDRGGVPSILDTSGCTAEVGGHTVEIDLEQAENAALITAVSIERGMPARAASIALATAFQESKLYNIEFGDRDSVGLFQQRPSQGWGTREQVLDPPHAIGRFYDGLVKVRGYPSMSITEAAQRVQRSAFPGAYAEHEDYARALASSLRGYSPAAFSCRINATSGGSAGAVADDIVAAFGDIPIEVGERSVRIPLAGRAPDVEARGWGLAHFAVGNATRLEIASVAFDGRQWTAEDSPDGWVVDPRGSRFPSDVVVIGLG